MNIRAAFPSSLRLAAAALWGVGFLFGLLGAAMAWKNMAPPMALPFIAVALLLSALGIGLIMGQPVAQYVTFVLLGAQTIAVAGAAYEIIHGVDGVKAHEIRALGFDPMLGLAINFAYSLAGTVLFVVALKRAMQQPRPST